MKVCLGISRASDGVPRRVLFRVFSSHVRKDALASVAVPLNKKNPVIVCAPGHFPGRNAGRLRRPKAASQTMAGRSEQFAHVPGSGWVVIDPTCDLRPGPNEMLSPATGRVKYHRVKANRRTSSSAPGCGIDGKAAA